MTELRDIQNFYFLGIGGIGMSALARYFKSLGKEVAGYDKTATGLTRSLEAEGINVIYEDEVNLIPEKYNEKNKALVVLTPAVPGDHQQLNYFRENGFSIKKRAEVLGMITKNTFTLAVAGTHGKTTTTAILGHLLSHSGAKVTAFLGGISEDINSNLILQGNEVMVVEADEFDRSFLKLSPNIAAITSMDADHLDIYGDAGELTKSFREFASLVPRGGKLFVSNGLDLQGTTIGVADDEADFSAININIKNGSYYFDLRTPSTILKNLQFNLPGKHNLQNAVTALAMALEYGAPPLELVRALSHFNGVKRRFSYKIKTEDFVLIDDYAHHPTEIAAAQQAVREMHPGEKVMVIFQPHLFSRTRDFADDFAESLSGFDEVRLLDIYPAREKPMEGITSEWLLEKVNNGNKKMIRPNEIVQEIRESGFKVIMMLGAGDIGEMVNRVEKELRNEN